MSRMGRPELVRYIQDAYKNKKMTLSEIAIDLRKKGHTSEKTGKPLTATGLRNFVWYNKIVSKEDHGQPARGGRSAGVESLIDTILEQDGISADAKVDLIRKLRKRE